MNNPIVILQHVVKGIQFYEYKDIADKIELGDKLTLKAEPLNPHDPRAIEIHHALGKLGHVARTETEKVHPFLDKPHEAVVTLNEPTRRLLVYTLTAEKADYEQANTTEG